MNIIPFQFESNNVRVIEQDGDPWFVAKDVAKLLGYKRTADAIRTHCKGVGDLQTPINGVLQTIKIIPERDVYRLIMRSKLPAAERFEEWVVGEVLPSIRKKGSYAIPEEGFKVPTTLGEALEIAMQIEEERKALKLQVKEDAPKVAFHDRVTESPNTMTVSEAAKVLGTGRNRLYAFMRLRGWLQSNNEPYQTTIEKGLLKLKLSPRFDFITEEYIDMSPVIFVTGKGLERLQKLWDERYLWNGRYFTEAKAVA